VTDAASTNYYAYVTDQGALKISNVSPHDRRHDLLGWYHPAKPWRCVAEIENDGSSNLDGSTLRSQIYQANFDYPRRRVLSAQGGVGDIAIASASSATYENTTTTPTRPTNQIIELNTRGRPVKVQLVPDGSANPAQVYVGKNTSPAAVQGFFKLMRSNNGAAQVEVGRITLSTSNSAAPTLVTNGPSAITFMDTAAPPGQNIYELLVWNNGNSEGVGVFYSKLMAWEE
jgi:hypothetical protein